MQIINILLTGRRTSKVERFGRRWVRTFGIGKELPAVRCVACRHSPARRAASSASGLQPVRHPATDTGCARGLWCAAGSLELRKPSEKLPRQRKLKARSAIHPAGTRRACRRIGDVFQRIASRVARAWRRTWGSGIHRVSRRHAAGDRAGCFRTRLTGYVNFGYRCDKLERYREPLLKVVRERAAGAG